MAQCEHGDPYKTAPDLVIASLPECQAGEGRHKCCICAYNEGMEVAKGKKFPGLQGKCPDDVAAPIDMLRKLPVNQGGIQRHKCVYTAYQLGLRDGSKSEINEEFEKKVNEIDETEAVALQKIRIGQQLFRRELLKFWHNECALTGISDNSLLVASHIKPWAKCEDNSERLDVYNGVLLSSLHDAAFDSGFLSFKDNGTPIYSKKLSKVAAKILIKSTNKTIKFSDCHLPYLKWHRKNLFN